MLAASAKTGAEVLVAEDDMSVREFLVRGLGHAGYRVVAVADGLAALEMLAGRHFDLLLTDIVMPGLDGIALALKVAQDYPRLRVLLMTGYAAERQRAHNLDVLVNQVLVKPFTLAEVCHAVAEVLALPPV